MIYVCNLIHKNQRHDFILKAVKIQIFVIAFLMLLSVLAIFEQYGNCGLWVND